MGSIQNTYYLHHSYDPSSKRDTMEGSLDTEVDNHFKYHRSLVRWVLKNDGYLHPNVKIAHSSERGFHAIVASGHTVPAETRIASCPMSVTMSVLNALDITPFSCRGCNFPYTFLRRNIDTPETLQAFFLMEQVILGERSWWAPYIQTLPSLESVQGLLFNAPDDLLWIEETNLKGGHETQAAKWLELYTNGIKELQMLKWPNAMNGRYSWELFRWAAIMFGSRSFTSQVLSDTLPADQARPAGRHDGNHADLVKLFSNRFAVLLPLLDLLNHKPMAQIEWQARYSFVGLQVLESYESGQELFNNYGPRDNEGLMLAYGFSIKDNPFDHVLIGLKAPPGSPLAESRTWKRDPRSDLEFNCYLFDIKHPRVESSEFLENAVLSYDLLDGISVLCGNDRELQTMFLRSRTLMSSSLGNGNTFEDFRNFLSTMSQILRDCEVRIAKLQATDPMNTSSKLQPRNQKQFFARHYRNSQICIYQTATAICRYVLIRAGTTLDQERILLLLHEKLVPEVYHILDRITRQRACLTRPNELFSVESIVQLLPHSLSTLWYELQQAVDKKVREMTPVKIIPQQGENGLSLTKSRFAVLLSVLWTESNRQNGQPLPLRLKTWLKELSLWYPPDDENWSYVPEPGPWMPGEEPPTALMTLLAATKSLSTSGVTPNPEKVQWIRADMLCWGWNVMEEEGIVLPRDVVQMAYPEETINGDLGFLVYCKQCWEG